MIYIEGDESGEIFNGHNKEAGDKGSPYLMPLFGLKELSLKPFSNGVYSKFEKQDLMRDNH